MSNEQTVREVVFFGMAESVDDVCEALGIDPDMSISELQRRLHLAEKALEHLGDGTLAWLTREDDQ